MSDACPSVGCPIDVVSSLYFFNQSFCIEYASMTTLYNFQFPESLKIIFCWDADVRYKWVSINISYNWFWVDGGN